jgi:Uncharacterized conserved protein
MAGDNPILLHWQKEHKILHDNVSVLRDKMNVDAIHDLRVAIKKIRSYRKLHAALLKKQEPSKAETIRELFSVFGRHRNMDIAKTLLISFFDKKKPPLNGVLVYFQLLQDQIAPFCQKVIQDFSEEPIEKWTIELNQDLGNLDPGELMAGVKRVMASSVKTVNHDLRHFKKNSHRIRKGLKDIFYWSNIFEEKIFFTKPHVKSLHNILDHLGNIQDYEVLLTNLKNFRKTILASSLDEYEQVKKVEINIEKKKDALMRRANEMTDKLFAHASSSNHH